VRRLFAEIKAGSFPTRGLLLGTGASYWTQWIEYSRQSATTLSRLSTPLLLIQCMNDETLPGDTLERNVAILRGVASTKTNARLHELEGHDHFAIRPGERESSPVFMRALLDWLRQTAARDVTRPEPVGYTPRA
jgi:pimeloyl-ACP methyl ester carboxylesterase